MHRTVKMALAQFAIVTWCLVVGVTPAGALAPQPIDASEQGPLAFVAMTVMIVLFVFSLFYMDRVRQRREDNASSRD
jgi:heme/copper-type cytochrome/quinol oxidase subunit 2